MALDPFRHTNLSNAKRMSRKVRSSSIYMPNSRNGSYLNAATSSYSRSRRSTNQKYHQGRMLMSRRRGFNVRQYLPVIGAVAAVVLLIFLVSAGVRACSAAFAPKVEAPETSLAKTLAQAAATDPNPTNKGADIGSLRAAAEMPVYYDKYIARIAAETTGATTRGSLDTLAAYSGMSLSLKHPQAAKFVAGLTDTEHLAVGYKGTVLSGVCPPIYQWDERWGYTEYCGSALGFTGCGVTVMAMARMGLTGQTDMGPAEMAALAVSLGEASAGTNSSFFSNDATTAATGVRGYTPGYVSADLISANAGAQGTYVAISVKPNTLAGGGHWVLAVGTNEDGTININDPNSPENTAQTWDANTLTDYAQSIYILQVA